MSAEGTTERDRPRWCDEPVLLTGATGFVGRSVYPVLRERGWEVRCASRRPEKARADYPDREWVYLDVEEPESLEEAMAGCGSALYLIHQMRDGEGYAERERTSAANFRDAAEQQGVERVVYLGGVAPPGKPSKHLSSRLQAGRVLRRGSISTIELRASMIIGEGSESWEIVLDLARRLPVMVLPAWTRSKSEPLHVSDVVEALIGALELPAEDAGWYDIPGPDAVTVREIMMTTARRLGGEPLTIDVPLLTPKLSSYWLQFVTECDTFVARQLVEGLKTDLLSESDAFWDKIGHRDRVTFETAVDRALDEVAG